MKNLKIVHGIAIFLITHSILIAQTPNKFNYQAVIRNSSGELVVDQNIGVKISILEGSETGSSVYTEIHSVTSDSYGIISLKVGTGDPSGNAFNDIAWTESSKYIKVEADITGNTNYVHIGTSELVSVPYAIQARTAEILGSKGVYATDSDTLFVVKDNNGNPVFAVFPDGAKIIVDQTAKGNIGGFAVSGRNPGKAEDVSIFSVTPDSTRVYVNNAAKGNIGGFAVSGRNPGKAGIEDILTVTSDSTRIYVNDAATKGNIGGFAVSGRNPGKANSSNFLNLTKVNYFIGHESGSKIVDGTYNSTLGYESGLNITNGSSNAFLGYQSGYSTQSGAGNLLLGYQSGYSNVSGNYNTFMGYQAGYSNFDGTNNAFLGSFTGKNNLGGSYNTFVGDSTGFNNTYGGNNVFIGTKVGFNNTLGWGNSFIGNFAGYNNNGSENVFIGDHSGYSNDDAGMNVFIGNESGYSNVSGWNNIYLGTESGYSNTEGEGNVLIGFQAGMNNTSGVRNIFIGNRAGMNEQGAGKLIIDNTDLDSTGALIWGDMTARFLRFNAKIGIGANPSYGYNVAIYNPDAPAIINLLGVGNTNDYSQIRLEADMGTDTLGYQLIHDIDNRFRVVYDDGSNLLPRLGVDALGNLMVGGDWGDATQKLDVDGNARFRSVGSDAYGYDLNITTTGILTTSSSDARLKENLQPIESSLNKVLRMNGYVFDWKAGKKQDVGLIAQEVKLIFPEIVFENLEDGYLGINYSRFPALFVEAFKEQQEIITSQQKQIDDLIKTVNELKKIVDKLNK